MIEITEKKQMIHQLRKIRVTDKFELPHAQYVTESTDLETNRERNGDRGYTVLIIVSVERKADMEAIAK